VTDPFSLPFGDTPSARPESRRRVLTITELTGTIRTMLESSYPQIWVEGEISNARLWKTGHLYFTLKDARAQIRAVMFRSTVNLLRFKPENGQHVVARGRVSVYDAKGEYQIVCEHLEPHGLGALQLAFEQLRERLAQEGLFDDARKRPLPALPRKIGVVTSPDGAAIRDILSILGRRYPNAHIVISPTRVQGEGASTEIVRALKNLERVSGIDVMIVARGGGSIEDLWAFNEEAVARAVADATVPVVSAVGHETDVTICDFVADVRAPTPSAAAELVVGQLEEFMARINRQEERLMAAARVGLQQRREKVHRLERRPRFSGWPTRLAGRGRHAAELTYRLSDLTATIVGTRVRRAHVARLRLEALTLDRRLGRIQTRLVEARARMSRGLSDVLGTRRVRLRAAAARLGALSPLGVLSRGYAVCWDAQRSSALRRATQVQVGDSVLVTLHSGELDCEVKGKR
jgi:exodeoxyribonuclease VII large subunit